MARKINKNKKEVRLNRPVFDAHLQDYTLKDIWHEMVTVYGMDISYGALGALVRNVNTWRLTYAWVVADILKVDIKVLFRLEDVDVDKKIEKGEEMRRKYQNQ